MSNGEEAPWSRADDALLAAAGLEANLVWSRYNAMLVIQTILLAIIAQALADTKFVISLGAVCIGLALAIPWWVITTVGWSLEHALLYALSPMAKEDRSSPYAVYLSWRGTGRQDTIWWCAHGVIIVISLAYVGIGAYAMAEHGLGAITTSIAVVVAVSLVVIGAWWSHGKQRTDEQLPVPH